MSNILITKTGTGFTVSNGTITVSGSNRTDLLAIMDTLENKPAAVAQIQEKVAKAAAVVQKKVAAKKDGRPNQVMGALEKLGQATLAEICEKLGVKDDDRKYFASTVGRMTDSGVLKRKENKEGNWTYKIA